MHWRELSLDAETLALRSDELRTSHDDILRQRLSEQQGLFGDKVKVVHGIYQKCHDSIARYDRDTSQRQCHCSGQHKQEREIQQGIHLATFESTLYREIRIVLK